MQDDHAVIEQVGRLLDPRRVAVIGASEDRGKFGGRVFHLLLHHRFPGDIYPVNPRRAELLGLTAYPSVAATPHPADVAVLAIPKPFIQRSIEECAAAGIGAAIVITSQFSEIGYAGAHEEAQLTMTARAGGMRLLGPNCLGFISPANGVVLTSSPALDIPSLRVGEVGLVSQSGALMATIFDRANDLGIGFSHCVSVGNQADLELADIVAYLIADERTRVICSYVEGFKDPARVRALAERARAAGKPWLMVKAGRTDAGGRAALSHTASIAGDYAVLEATARDTGIVLMDDPDAMVLAAATMSRFGCRPVRQVAVVTTSGGGGAITADRLSDAAIPLTAFAPETVAALDAHFMPGQASNPVDLGGRREGEAVDIAAATLAAVAHDPGVELQLLVLSTAPALPRIAADLAAAATTHGTPHLFVVWPGSAATETRQRLREAHAPFCDRLDDAVRAVAGWLAWSAHTPPTVENRPALDSAAISALLDTLSPGPVGEATTKELLARCGIAVNTGQLAASADEAVTVAETLGYPVALKAAVDVIHKSDAGGVALGLGNAAAVREAWTQIADNLARKGHDASAGAMLVQEMVTGDAELIVGARDDPQFGPVVLVGMGGIFAELLRDVQIALAPIGPQAATALLRRLRGWPILAGARGRPPADIARIADIVSRVSWLAFEAHGRLAELDINPLIVAQHGAVAVDARMVLR